MSWAIVKNDQVIEILNSAKAVTINGTQYPSSIFSAWSKADLKNIGIYPTQITSTIDSKTHRATGGVTYTVNTDHVAVHYGKVAHVLENVSSTDEDGNSILTEGLKTRLLAEVDNQAYGQLQSSDWMAVRQVEAGVTIADDWKTWRASIRTQAKAMKTAINAVTTITDVPGLYVVYGSASDGTMTSVSSGHLWHWPKNPDEA